MGLTREQWQAKRLNEIKSYVQSKGHKVGNFIYWNTYPICVKDICVLGVGIFNDKLIFSDYNSKENKFTHRRNAEDVERKYLEEVLADMKQLDKNKS